MQKETLVLYTVCKSHMCLCITIREHKTGSWSLVVNNIYCIILFINQYGSVLKSISFYTLTLLIGSLFQNVVSLMVKNLLISSLIAFIASLYAFILVSAPSFTINSFSLPDAYPSRIFTEQSYPLWDFIWQTKQAKLFW